MKGWVQCRERVPGQRASGSFLKEGTLSYNADGDGGVPDEPLRPEDLSSLFHDVAMP